MNVRSDDNSTSLSEESSYKMGAFVESRRESLIPTDTDQLIPTMPFVNLLTVKASQQQSPTNAVNGNELCDRLKAIEFDKDANDANGNVPVTKSVSSCNDDFIIVELGVRTCEFFLLAEVLINANELIISLTSPSPNGVYSS